jgi:hypothetical protein
MRAAGDRFCELLDFAVPWQDGVAVVLVAYFDASEREGGDFCVAGLAFSTKKAKRAIKLWTELWGDQQCHMTDLHTRKANGAFADWTPERAGKRLVDSIEIISKYATYGVAISCEMAEMRRLMPADGAPGTEPFLDGFSSAYAVCCHMAMTSLGILIENRKKDSGGVAYFFEKGDLHQGRAQRFLSMATEVPPLDGAPSPLKNTYKHVSHTVLRKEDSRLFEMADIFAWEWAKHREQRRAGRENKRGSLAAILGAGVEDENNFASPHRRAIHLTGERLERYFERIKFMILSPAEDASVRLREFLAARGLRRG